MNYIDELKNSYTINGKIDLDALEDDMEYLSRVIEHDEKKLDFLRYNRSNVGYLPEAIRQQQDKLIALEKIYKEELKNGKVGSAIDDVLEDSAKEAKEVEKPEVAAAGKPIKMQDFQGAQIEKDADGYDWQDSWALTTGTEEQRQFYLDKMKPVATEKPKKEEEVNYVANEDGYTPDMKIIVSVDGEPVDGNGRVYQKKAIKAESEKLVDQPAQMKVEHNNNLEATGHPKIELNTETGEIEVKCNVLDANGPDYIIPSSEMNVPNPCADCDVVTCISNPKNENGIRQLEVVPAEEDEPELEIDPSDYEVESGDDVGGDIYEPFWSDKHKAYAEFALADYTGIINTDSVKGRFNVNEKTIELNFSDMRDVDIFHVLVKEKNEKLPFYKKLLKKPKSIFMYVHEKHDEPGWPKETVTTYEFIGCEVLEVFSPAFMSLREAQQDYRQYQEWLAVFKYKKLKVY